MVYFTCLTVYNIIYRRHLKIQTAKEGQRSPYELDKRPSADQYFAYGEKIEVENRDHFATAYAATGDQAARNYRFM